MDEMVTKMKASIRGNTIQSFSVKVVIIILIVVPLRCNFPLNILYGY
jgi:hypothetical protein